MLRIFLTKISYKYYTMKSKEFIVEEKLSKEQREETIKDFISFVRKKLHVKDTVDINFSYDSDDAKRDHHTGAYNINTHQMFVYMHERNLVDILRTIAHEFQHVKQGHDGRLHQKNLPVSKIEAEADTVAGWIIKLYGKDHRHIYE